jgi:methyl-accepting chemotaxis protein
MGYPLAEIVGRHHRMFVDGSDRDTPAYARFWADLAAGAFKAGQFKRLSKGGQEVWIQASYDPVLNASGKPCKIIKFAADITSQKRGLADLEGQIAAINRSNAVISFALDGTILDANDNFLKAMGYRLEEVKGRHHSMFVEAAQRGSAAYAQFWADLAAGRYFSAEFKRVAKGGAEVWIQASYNPILDPSGKPFQVVKFATDVTARVRAQQTLSTSINTSAAGAEELNASIGEIAENMARSRGAATSALELSHSAEGVVGRLGGAAQAMNGVVAESTASPARLIFSRSTPRSRPPAPARRAADSPSSPRR